MSESVAWLKDNYLWTILGLVLALAADVATSIYSDVSLGSDAGGLPIFVGTTGVAVLLGLLARHQDDPKSRCLAGGIGMGLVVVVVFLLFVEDKGFIALVPPIAAVKAIYVWGIAWGTVLVVRRFSN